MAQPHFEMVTESVESIRFSFYTDDEVRNMSFKKITNPVLFDNLRKPTEGGLYDPALGPIDFNESCKSCGEPSVHCPGHCGHIDLVLPVYNPLLFGTLHKLLKRICFSCHHFMMNSERIQNYVSKLELIKKGDMVRAKSESYMAIKEKKSESDIQFMTADTMACSMSQDFEQRSWTSLQYHEARSIFDEVMSENFKKCENCESSSSKIKSPSFGRLYMDALASSKIRANVIRGSTLDNMTTLGGVRPFIDEKMMQPADDISSFGNVIDPSGAESGSISDGEGRNADLSHKNTDEHLPPEFFTQKNLSKQTYLTPLQVKYHLRLLWENEPRFCPLVSDIQQESLGVSGKNESYSCFFIQALLVPPSKFRAPSKGGNNAVVLEHPQNVLLGKVLQNNLSLGDAITTLSVDSERLRVIQTLYRWMNLQESVNVLVDSSKATDNKDKGGSGICQLLEKKEGIFRQKMMGKRVNFSCRSVISPDPYLAVNEIGIPPYFAERLTYPEKVTPWNVDKLRHAIINGPEIHPGATHYADKMGMTKLPFLKNKRISIAKKLPTSRGVVSHPGKILDSEFEGKVVYRHLQDGDIVLVNRQPTLHKPSMMAHVVRVLKGEKTLRMHYANCSTYNADFDGDEMNVHFPQDEIARAEASYIVNANEQYIVPTSGNPTRGLIQDHIVSAVLITMKNTFLTKEEYHQLLYTALVSTIAPDPRPGKCGKKVCSIKSDAEFQALPPAILRPKQLWTGKQVITTILNHIARGQPPFTMKIMGKVPIETEVLIQKNELLQGIIDKAQFAKYGLVHTVQELYGANTAGFLLSVFSRLFTGFLQMHGFTCGVDDLLITREAELERKKKLEKSEMIGESVHSKFVGAEDGSFDPVKLQMEIEKILRSKGESASIYLDRKMSSELNRLTSEVNDLIFNGERNQTGGLFQGGLLKRFPYNCLSLMTTTGAKGSQVNFQQISSLLGQQDLEGKRVPRMVSGKTLPCFPPWDWASRAGGFISDRYLTGLRPQEYYFHCMAGRDGLVDTAIKTSRSGYLQRCLIKNLECLKVCYDYTVRDADGSVVQFCYGEDGVDVLRTSCISEFLMLANNQKSILERLAAGQPKDADIFDSNSYMKELPDALVRKANEFIDGLSKKDRDSLNLRKRKHFMKLMKLKYLTSLAQPGEPVGVIAAQSIGEPSTQMTLNTFHFAGRGEMNVTLGIPRLKEILTLASKKILTPVMTCPLQWGRTRDDAQHLAAKLLRVRLADLVESMEVYVVPFSIEKQEITTTYKLKLKLYPPEFYPPYSNITEEECEEALKSMFFPQFVKVLETYVKKLSRETDGITTTSENLMHDFTKQIGDDDSGNKYSQSAEGNGDDDKDDDEDEEDQGFDALKRKRQVNDDMDYEDEGSGLEDGEEEHMGFYGEAVQFEDGDYDTKEDQSRLFDAEVEVSKSSTKQEIISKSKPSSKAAKSEAKEKMAKSKPSKKQKKSRGLLKATILNASGTNFEAQFRFWEGTHVLLSQMAEKLAKRIYIRSTNSIDQCTVIDWSSSSNSKEKPKIPALQTAGVNFQAIWELGDDLDFRNLHSNHINAMLETYGVEAARATIISEVKNVFQLYGITVDSRHLSLVADFMTHNGGYRPMNRFGIVQSTSPLHKTTFETATKFLVEAAYHREVENLESASARIVLGMPVKMGTGCFDVLQNLEV